MVASLEALARRLGLAGPSALAAVFGRWEDVVGPLLAAHTRPVSLTGGVLVVAVDEPGWATQLRFLADDVVARLNEHAGAGTVLRCVVQVEGPARGSRTGQAGDA